MVDNGFISAPAAAAVDPATIRIQQPTSKENSVRYFTDWALPQLDTLIDESSEPIDVWTTLDPRMQSGGRPGDCRQHAGRSAGRAGGDRPRRRRAGNGRRPRLCRFDLQSRDPGGAPARLGVQAVRLSGGARIGHEADRHDRRRAGHDRRLERRATRTAPTLARFRCARRFRDRSTPSAPRSAPRSASGPSPTWRAGSGSASRFRPIPRWCSGPAKSGLIDMTRAFAAVGNKRRRGQPLCDPQGGHRRRPPALPARRRRGAGAGRAVGRGGDDRPAAIGGAERHRPRGADRPPGRRQDRHHQRPTRTAGSSVFRAA